MNALLLSTLGFARKLAGKTGLRRSAEAGYAYVNCSGDAAALKIREVLSGPSPAMIGRFGTSELFAVLNYVALQDNGPGRYFRYVFGRTPYLAWDPRVLSGIFINAGFFPADPHRLEGYARMMLDDMPLLDILGSWIQEEAYFRQQLDGIVKVPLPDIEPFFSDHPWTAALEGKRVLVIHPFEESIRRQYAQKELLFADPRILPDFELLTLRAVQSSAQTRTEFADWFQALESMKEKVSRMDFDIALIGCGAYGMPLAAHVKRMGKKSVLIGGSVQILFGIRGKRWEEHSRISSLFNPHWTRPLPSETPENFSSVENGCYW
jgi:hypothetical protein